MFIIFWVFKVLYIAFEKLRHIFERSLPQCLKTRCSTSVVMTYGAETWNLTLKLLHQLYVTQSAKERSVLSK